MHAIYWNLISKLKQIQFLSLSSLFIMKKKKRSRLLLKIPLPILTCPDDQTNPKKDLPSKKKGDWRYNLLHMAGQQSIKMTFEYLDHCSSDLCFYKD